MTPGLQSSQVPSGPTQVPGYVSLRAEGETQRQPMVLSARVT